MEQVWFSAALWLILAFVATLLSNFTATRGQLFIRWIWKP